MRTPPYCFVKLPGGKTRILQSVISRLPSEINTYFEPMVGGGAVFIELAKQKRFKKAFISDTNADVINAWSVIKRCPLKLIDELQHQKYSYDKTLYLESRAQKPSSLTRIERAARFIYLNRICFNGIYRLNSKGEFNVPFGKYTDPLICDADNIKAVSNLLKNVTIRLTSSILRTYQFR
jgi:DNA adenine methylase